LSENCHSTTWRGSRGKYWGGAMPPQTEASSGERQQRENRSCASSGMQYGKGTERSFLHQNADASSSSNSVSCQMTYQLNCYKPVTKILGDKVEVCVPTPECKTSIVASAYRTPLQFWRECSNEYNS